MPGHCTRGKQSIGLAVTFTAVGITIVTTVLVLASKDSCRSVFHVKSLMEKRRECVRVRASVQESVVCSGGAS